MVLLTQSQSFTLAKSAGFTDKDAEVAAAISLAETLTYQAGVQYADFSKVGDLSLVDKTWGPSYGGWQIRSLLADTGKNTIRDALRLDEPNWNAKAAYEIWKEGTFKRWSTYTSGAYLGYMQHAKYNPQPSIPKGSYLVTGGDSLTLIAQAGRNGQKNYPWLLIAKINNIPDPGYTIFPGQVILLPDWPYMVQSGDSLTKIATNYAKVTFMRIADYNGLYDPNKLSVGQRLWIPRYTSWDGKTLV
jgi:nucleoid-associated protein YgaU